MPIFSFSFPSRLVIAALAISLAWYSAARAEDKTETKSKPEASEDSTDESSKPEKSRFAMPEGGVKELLEFVNKYKSFRPKNREELIEFQTVGRPALKQAIAKILEIATPEEKQLEGYSDLEGLLLMLRASEVRTASPEERQNLLEDLKQYFTVNEAPSNYAVNAAMQLATSLEFGGKPEQAADVYRDLGAILARSKSERIATTGVKMEGAARRLELVGKPLEISGTLMDGEKFNWDAYRGKVVLVDFWATWCGPCLAELPNVKRNYELYHDKGFDVVGISLDNDRAALEKFLETKGSPWVTLYDGPWNDNAVATYYGIMGIPAVILVDKDGKVVSTNARGPELGLLLAELLGPAEPAETPAGGEADKAEK